MKEKITIVIPCYNQTKLLKRNLGYLEKQSDQDFDIVILDDNSSEDYQKVIAEFPNLKISYVRNEVNAGAIQNIFNSILYKTKSPFILSLHEDDVLHPDYLKKAKDLLEHNEHLTFVCTLAHWFKTDAELEKAFAHAKNLTNLRMMGKDNFIRQIIDGTHVTFGSIIYRTKVLTEKPDFITFDVFCDRPFLISLLKEKSEVGLIADKAIFVRDHGESDNRFSTITEAHALNLMSFYKNNLPQPLSASDTKKIQTFATNNLLGAYAGLKNKKMTFREFIAEGKKLGLINFKYINRIGAASLFKLVFGEKAFNKVIKIIKK